MQNRSVVTGKAKNASDGTPQLTDTALIREARLSNRSVRATAFH